MVRDAHISRIVRMNPGECEPLHRSSREFVRGAFLVSLYGGFRKADHETHKTHELRRTTESTENAERKERRISTDSSNLNRRNSLNFPHNIIKSGAAVSLYSFPHDPTALVHDRLE